MAIARERSKQYASANKNRNWTPEDIFQVLAPGEIYENETSTGQTGQASNTTKVTMPAGSVQEFDPTGKRVK